MWQWLCVAKTQPLPAERRALVARILVAADLGSSASGKDSAEALERGWGFGLELGRRRVVQSAPHAHSVAPRWSAGWARGLRQPEFDTLPSLQLATRSSADLGPAVTLLYVTNVSSACLPIWLCILKC